MSGIGAPLGLDVTANSAPAEQGMLRIDQRVKQTEGSLKRATLAAKDLNAEMSKQLRAGAVAARGTAAAAGFSAAAGGVAAGGVAGTIAVGAAAAATLYQVLNRFAQLSEESARRQIDASNSLVKASEKAIELRTKSAQEGLSQEQLYRKAAAEGGPNAIRTADDLMKGGFTPDEAYKIAATGPIDEKMRAILDTIRVRGGDVVAAAADMAKRPYMSHINDAAFRDPLLRQTYVSRAADDVQNLSRKPGDPFIASDPRNDTWLRSDDFARATERHRQMTGRRAIADRANAAAGFGDAADQRSLAESTNPEAVTRGDALKEMTRAVDQLSQLAEMQSKPMALLADIFQPGGSFETQMARLVNSQTRAVYGPQ